MKKILVLAAFFLPLCGFAQDTLKCEIVKKDSKNLAGTELKGVVTDVKDYKPLDDVKVTIKAAGDDEVVKSIETDAKGSFSFKDIPAGKYEISFQRDGYKPYNYDAVWVNEGKTCSLGFPLYKM